MCVRMCACVYVCLLEYSIAEYKYFIAVLRAHDSKVEEKGTRKYWLAIDNSVPEKNYNIINGCNWINKIKNVNLMSALVPLTLTSNISSIQSTYFAEQIW